MEMVQGDGDLICRGGGRYTLIAGVSRLELGASVLSSFQVVAKLLRGSNPRPRPQIKTGAMEGYKRKGGVKVITFNQVCIAISAIAAVALKLLGKTDDSVWFLCVLIFLCLTEERIEKKEGRD